MQAKKRNFWHGAGSTGPVGGRSIAMMLLHFKICYGSEKMSKIKCVNSLPLQEENPSRTKDSEEARQRPGWRTYKQTLSTFSFFFKFQIS